MLNALIDYPLIRKPPTRVQKLFMKSKYPLSIIKTDEANGIITVAPNAAVNYRIEVSDYFGNKTTVNIPVEYASDPALTTK